MRDASALGLTEQSGSLGADDLRGDERVVVLGLAGSDTLRATASATVITGIGGDQFLARGSDSETYVMASGTSAVIVSGSESANDRLSLPALALSRDSANVLEVGGHLAALDSETGSVVIIVDWLAPERKIEEIVFEDATIRVDAGGVREIRGLEGYLGKLSWSEFEELLSSSSSFSKSEAAALRDLVESVGARAGALEQAASDISTVVADLPEANDDSFTVAAVGLGKKGALLDLLDNDVASKGSLRAKSLRIVDEADNGSVTVKKGKVFYKPEAGFEGEDTFSYTVKDKGGMASDAATVRVEVNQPDPPKAVADTFSVDAANVGKKGVLLDILVNDVAYTGSLRAKSLTIVNDPDNGSVTVKKGKLYYKPDSGFEGEDTFSYTVKDKSGLVSAEALVRVEVEGAVLRAADLIDHGDLVVEPGSDGSFREEQAARKSIAVESGAGEAVYVEGVVATSWITEGETG